MNPKDKASMLMEKYYNLFSINLENTISIYEAAFCAVIAVDELINDTLEFEKLKYWNEVKKHLYENQETN